MSTRSNHLESQPSSLKNRRKFLVNGSLATLGLTLAPSNMIKASITPGGQWKPFFLGLLSTFATYVGFWLEQKAAESYIRETFGTQGDPWRSYRQPRSWGYDNEPTWGFYRSASRYYLGSNLAPTQEGDGRIIQVSYNRKPAPRRYYSYIFYPWMIADQRRSLVTFQSLVQSRSFGVHLATPTVYGLNLAAQRLNARWRSQYRVSQALFPSCECLSQNSISGGSFDDSYDEPDIYKGFDGGEVAVDYERLNRRQGKVTVKHTNLLTGEVDYLEADEVPLRS